jgi:hypothetical protein
MQFFGAIRRATRLCQRHGMGYFLLTAISSLS